MEDYTLSIPLLATPAGALTTTIAPTSCATKKDDENGVFSSGSSIIYRLLLVILIGTISIWANHEASKGFKVTIINAAAKESPAGRRFDLFYVSNDEATRIILSTSAVVENILYADQSEDQTKKPVHHVVLQLAAGDNLTATKVSVDTSRSKEPVYVISLSPSIMEESNVKYSVISTIQRAMARIWLWDGKSRAPPWLIAGMEEYIWMQAGFGHHDKETALHSRSKFRLEQFCSVLSQVCSKSSKLRPGLKMNISAICGDHWKWEKTGGVCREEDDKNPKIVALALGYIEQKHKGYVQGLNQILRDGWD
ncbi:hypothetical protein E1A91_D04G042200v1 [Gossypium mustelinum]|uniref:Uncharacterized protein n=1 Tax=Gossypium mustelinum TaxID=34275 RepID=A0A5D2V9P1_GOSMU|nr:hypothetical protein E1A91_D04G042200v1 [Gossypium mustelinum]